MNSNATTLTPAPPRLLATLVKGFNIVANHVHLILIPLLLDLFLWLGPKMRIKALLQPMVDEVVDTTLKVAPVDLAEIVASGRTLWEQLLSEFNLFTMLRTLPVGVPSLIARGSGIGSPLEGNLLLEATSIRMVVLVAGLLLVAGFLLGTLYLNQVSRYTAVPFEKLDWRQMLSQFAQSVLLFAILILLVILIVTPLMLIVSVLSLINAAIGQVVILVVAFMAIWVIMPLIFAPHGIFAMNLKAFQSMQFSLRLVRAFLPGTGLFILISALISEGMNLLWQLPGTASWLTVVGIAGHAFVVTALITGTFIYYREGVSWMQYALKIFEASRKQENGGLTIDKQ